MYYTEKWQDRCHPLGWLCKLPLWFYKNNIGMERTNYKRVEMKALVDSALKCSNHNYGESSNQQSKKHEAYSL